MATMQALLEKDKERFLNNMAAAKSSAESVATVEGGVVTGLREGNVTITVTTVDGGYTASCTVTVIRAEGVVGSQGFEEFEKQSGEWDPED